MRKQRGLERKTGQIDLNKIPSVMDGEFDSDLSLVKKCEKCGSFNISMDNLGSYTCRDCKHQSKTATKVDYQKIVEKMVDDERKGIEEGLKRGETFGI
jgi:ribosomal protein L37AE/L43A